MPNRLMYRRIYLCKFLGVKAACQGLITLWYIWFVRNKVKHESSWASPSTAASRIQLLAAEFGRACKQSSIISCYDFEWRPPPFGHIKINCDARWNECSRKGGLAAVARDHDGVVLAVRTQPVFDCVDSVHCEGLGLVAGIELGVELGVDNIIFELDCAHVVGAINCRNNVHIGNAVWYTTAIRALEDHSNWSVVLIRREANRPADYLANKALRSNLVWRRADACPNIVF
ncbi:hypothetical protein QQ045_015859 [Rhodiola kirilowii]